MAQRGLRDLLRAHPQGALIIVFGLYACVLALSVKVRFASDVTVGMAAAIAGGTWVYGILLSLGVCWIWKTLSLKKGGQHGLGAVGLAALEGAVFFVGAVAVFLPGLVLTAVGLPPTCQEYVALDWGHVALAGIVAAYWPGRAAFKHWRLRGPVAPYRQESAG